MRRKQAIAARPGQQMEAQVPVQAADHADEADQRRSSRVRALETAGHFQRAISVRWGVYVRHEDLTPQETEIAIQDAEKMQRELSELEPEPEPGPLLEPMPDPAPGLVPRPQFTDLVDELLAMGVTQDRKLAADALKATAKRDSDSVYPNRAAVMLLDGWRPPPPQPEPALRTLFREAPEPAPEPPEPEPEPEVQNMPDPDLISTVTASAEDLRRRIKEREQTYELMQQMDIPADDLAVLITEIEELKKALEQITNDRRRSRYIDSEARRRQDDEAASLALALSMQAEEDDTEAENSRQPTQTGRTAAWREQQDAQKREDEEAAAELRAQRKRQDEDSRKLALQLQEEEEQRRRAFSNASSLRSVTMVVLISCCSRRSGDGQA